MNAHKIPASVQVVCRNSMPGIKACLESLQEFDEVIVQDGNSTDGTRETAQSYANVTLMAQNPKFLNAEGRIIDFSAMRNESIAAAKHDWIFVVDADEAVEQAMVDEVRSIVAKNVPGVFQAFRRFVVEGKKIHYSCMYPAVQIRLFHRTAVEGYRKPIHERLALAPGMHTTMLQTELPIPLPSAAALQPKFDRYLAMEAKRGRQLSVLKWCRWVLYRNIRSAAILTLRLLWIWIIPRQGARMPLAYEWQYIRHVLRTIPASAPWIKQPHSPQ